jgi:hypothetical protein
MQRIILLLGSSRNAHRGWKEKTWETALYGIFMIAVRFWGLYDGKMKEITVICS